MTYLNNYKTNTQAYAVFKFLKKRSNNFEGTVTYKDLGEIVGVHYRHLGAPLSIIQELCKKYYLPALQSLCVNGKTGLPGSGCYYDDSNLHAEQLQDIKDFDGDWVEIETALKGLINNKILN